MIWHKLATKECNFHGLEEFICSELFWGFFVDKDFNSLKSKHEEEMVAQCGTDTLEFTFTF